MKLYNFFKFFVMMALDIFSIVFLWPVIIWVVTVSTIKTARPLRVAFGCFYLTIIWDVIAYHAIIYIMWWANLYCLIALQYLHCWWIN